MQLQPVSVLWLQVSSHVDGLLPRRWWTVPRKKWAEMMAQGNAMSIIKGHAAPESLRRQVIERVRDIANKLETEKANLTRC